MKRRIAAVKFLEQNMLKQNSFVSASATCVQPRHSQSFPHVDGYRVGLLLVEKLDRLRTPQAQVSVVLWAASVVLTKRFDSGWITQDSSLVETNGNATMACKSKFTFWRMNNQNDIMRIILVCHVQRC